MLLDSYFDSAIIIDNTEKEGRALEQMLNEHDIRTDFILFKSGDEIKNFKRNRKLIFFDLMLDENVDHYKENISTVINTLATITNQSNFGLYGLIVWTKHKEYESELQTRIEKACNIHKDNLNRETIVEEDEEEDVVQKLENPPLFILLLDKSKYIVDDQYSKLNADLENLLKGNDAAYFYLKWCQSVEDAKRKSILDIYRLIGDYSNYSNKFTYLLQRLAMNQTGIKNVCECQTIDAYKAFDELLYANLFCQQSTKKLPELNKAINNPFNENEITTISSTLNSKFFIDTEGINQDIVVPGNIYEIRNIDSPIKLDIDEKYLKGIKKDNVNFICIELTPPCDFSNKKIGSRVVSGIIYDKPEKKLIQEKNVIM